jgi:hypothetical protein
MKRLEIKNFVKRMDDIDSDYFGVRYSASMEDKYIIGIDTRDVVSFRPLKPKHYKMSIDKVMDEWGNYGIWLWDMESNVSYPMSIRLDDISSLPRFTSFLNHTLKLADEGQFGGSNGCMIK